jgi:hypothetical protein
MSVGIQAVRSGCDVVCVGVVATRRASGSEPSLLPGPATLDASGAAAAMGALYLLVSKRRDHQTTSAKVQIDATQARGRACLNRELEALSREKAHREDSGGGLFASLGKIVSDLVGDAVHLHVEDAFDHLRENGEAAWNSPKFWAELEDGAVIVGKVAAVAASAAGTVATLGATGPALVAVVIAVSLSAASFAEDQTHVLESLGVSAEAAAWTSFGCAAAGAIVTAGVGASTLAGQASQLSKVAHAVELTGQGVAAGAEITVGVAHARRGAHAAMAEEAVADRSEAQHARARVDRQLLALIDVLQESDKSVSRTLEALEGAVRTQGQCMVLSTARA